jgi:hypothetical protein
VYHRCTNPTWTSVGCWHVLGSARRFFGLGDLVLDEARTRCAHGRVELVLHDSDTNRLYAVALQIGATDDRHFLRAVELWAAERKRAPRRCLCRDREGACTPQRKTKLKSVSISAPATGDPLGRIVTGRRDAAHVAAHSRG